MKNTIGELISTFLLLLPMMLAATFVAGLVQLVGGASSWPWWLWAAALPVLYLIWLISYLALSAWTCWLIGREHPKPRYKAFRPGVRLSTKDTLSLLTVVTCYRRFAVAASLPLGRPMQMSPLFGWLSFRAYSPSVHVGAPFSNFGFIYDPDLTVIGDNAIIGSRAAIVAHGLTTRPNGEIVYVSAPITIGNRATIGGDSRVALGCQIEDDAVVEPGSIVAPFTRIPAGEIWGGSPAQFLRRRDDPNPTSARDVPISNGRETDDRSTKARDFDAKADQSTDGISSDEVRQVVLTALDLTADPGPGELSSDSCAAWDSLGQVAIAAAIFDRYGIKVDAGDVFRLRTIQDVADAIRPARPPSRIDARADRATGPRFLDGPEAERMDDVDLLPLLDSEDTTRSLAYRFQGQPPAEQHLQVVIAATFVAQPLANALKTWGRAFDFEIQCELVAYDQVVATLFDASGPFAMNSTGINVILARPEDLFADDGSTGRADAILDALEHYASQRGGDGSLLVASLPPVVSAFAPAAATKAEALRRRWRDRLETMADIEVFDLAAVVERLGTDAARASQTEALMRAPYSPRLYQELGIALVRTIRAQRRSPAKVVAVDADNTLWGGVVGEVGVNSLELGPDGPGRSYQLFQRYLKDLKERGVLLAVVSKNEERDVRDVFEKHPDMVLRPDDIAAWRVNWQPKSQNLRELAEELNLGIDSIVFLDDDPVVRLEVKSRLPGVHVVPLPADPAQYCETLSRLWLFDGATVSAVDATRTQMMHEETQRQQVRRSAIGLEDYLASLELRVTIAPPTELEWARVAQLTQRTNQFNLSLKRRTVGEVRAIGESASVLALKAKDRFGDYGLVGVGILRPGQQSEVAEIDTLLMSCRALGRGVETALLNEIGRVAARRGATTLVAPTVDGPRNGQVKEFLARSGFVKVAPDRWCLPLAELPSPPGHVQIDRADSLVTSGRSVG